MLGKENQDVKRAFGETLRGLRKANGLSQEQLALDSGVQRNFVSLIELGQSQATIGTLFRLCLALNKKPSAFLEQVEIRLAKDRNQPPEQGETRLLDTEK
jgi:transcriptional regulator with XRE-family HTH domain